MGLLGHRKVALNVVVPSTLTPTTLPFSELHVGYILNPCSRGSSDVPFHSLLRHLSCAENAGRSRLMCFLLPPSRLLLQCLLTSDVRSSALELRDYHSRSIFTCVTQDPCVSHSLSQSVCTPRTLLGPSFLPAVDYTSRRVVDTQIVGRVSDFHRKEEKVTLGSSTEPLRASVSSSVKWESMFYDAGVRPK